jgi:hypothetical protein
MATTPTPVNPPTPADPKPKPVGVIDERQDAAAKYRIITAGEEIITRTAEQLARASKIQIGAEVWADNFWRMIEHVRQWADLRKDKLHRVVVVFRSDKVVFGIVPRSDSYDYDLGFEQAELDIHLNTRGNIGYIETRQIPHWDETTFIPPEAWQAWPAK